MPELYPVAQLRRELGQLAAKGESYFASAVDTLREADSYLAHSQPNYYWDRLRPDEQQESVELSSSVVVLVGRIADLARQATLVTEADQRDLSFLTKTLRASLALRRYSHWDAEVLHDEGTVLGVRRAGQSDNEALAPTEALRKFQDGVQRVTSIIDLIAASALSLPTEDASPRTVSRIRQDTAFIMMWMDSSHPELDDICDAVKNVFSSFGVRAIRADDIEHEGVITDRILAEIEGSEFLIADLTGARPSVYYEVGYAHALKKRVILYRKRGTQLHFDLAGYNCPEYDNLRDLRDKLTRRLEQLTNKQPR